MKSQSWLTQLGLFDNEQWTPMKRVKNNVNQCFCQWVPMKTMVSNRIGPITPGKFRESSWKDPFEQWSKHLLIVWIGTMNLLRNSWCDPQKIETCFQDEMAMIFPRIPRFPIFWFIFCGTRFLQYIPQTIPIQIILGLYCTHLSSKNCRSLKTSPVGFVQAPFSLLISL